MKTTSLIDIGNTALDLLYPPHCSVCGTGIPRDSNLCDACIKEAPRLSPPFCSICSQPFSGEIDDPFQCPNCGQEHFEFDHAVAAFRSRGLVRDLIHRFKYRGEYQLRLQLGIWLLEALEDPRIAGRHFDAVVPVPLHATRKRERQFNQAEELAIPVARRLQLPVLNALKRVRHTETQTHFDRKERMENLRNAFESVKNAPVTNLALLLVDDVFTTGSTVRECAKVLRKAGAQRISVIAVARG